MMKHRQNKLNFKSKAFGETIINFRLRKNSKGMERGLQTSFSSLELQNVSISFQHGKDKQPKLLLAAMRSILTQVWLLAQAHMKLQDYASNF